MHAVFDLRSNTDIQSCGLSVLFPWANEISGVGNLNQFNLAEFNYAGCSSIKGVGRSITLYAGKIGSGRFLEDELPCLNLLLYFSLFLV